MFFKVTPKKVYLISKFAARYCGTFEILEKIGLVAYELALIPSIKVHNVFHVSLLKKYVHDPRNIIEWNMIHVNSRVDACFLN